MRRALALDSWLWVACGLALAMGCSPGSGGQPERPFTPPLGSTGSASPLVAPTLLSARAGVREVELVWTMPLDRRGSRVTGFVLTPHLGDEPLPPTTVFGARVTNHRVTGLANGTAYRFTVAALYGDEVGPSSERSAEVLTPDLPGAPRQVVAKLIGRKAATLTWEPPAQDGGRPVTDYNVVLFPPAAAVSITVDGTRATVNGLEPGRVYAFGVLATNDAGDGALGYSQPLQLPCARYGFSPALSVPTGQQPVALSVADFDADGRLDVATANGTGGTVSLLRGRGDGTFGVRTDFPAGPTPSALVVSDLNSDGANDLAVLNHGKGTVSVLLSVGDGAFAPPLPYATDSTCLSLIAQDLDADGIPDLGAACYGHGRLSLFFGQGDGTFGPRVDHDESPHAFSLASADFNADGRPDLAVANTGTGSSIGVRLGLGSGVFGKTLESPAGAASYSAASGDFNADGRPDLALTSADSHTVVVLLGEGNGGFAPKVEYPTGGTPSSLVAVDLDRDHHLDLAVANRASHTVSVLFGRGDGTFAPRVDLPTGAQPRAVGSGDFNADGRPDLAVANADGHDVSVLLSTCVE